jgi:hypothetical protein
MQLLKDHHDPAVARLAAQFEQPFRPLPQELEYYLSATYTSVRTPWATHPRSVHVHPGDVHSPGSRVQRRWSASSSGPIASRPPPSPYRRHQPCLPAQPAPTRPHGRHIPMYRHDACQPIKKSMARHAVRVLLLLLLLVAVALGAASLSDDKGTLAAA